MRTNNRRTLLVVFAILSTTTATISAPKSAVEFYDVESTYSFARMDMWWTTWKYESATKEMCKSVEADILQFESYTEVNDFIYILDELYENFRENTFWTNGRRVRDMEFYWAPNDFEGTKMWCRGQPQYFNNDTTNWSYDRSLNCMSIDYNDPNWCFRTAICGEYKKPICEKKKYDYVYVAPEYDYVGKL